MSEKQWISLRKPKQEIYEGRRVMTDPGVHGAMALQLDRKLRKGATVLDIGAGAGAFSLRMRQMGYCVSAVDVNAENFGAEGVDFRRIRAGQSLSALWGRESFDAAVAIEVIEHTESTIAFLRDVTELLKPGGFLFLTTPNLCSFYSRLVFLKEGRFHHFQGRASWDEVGHINPVPFFVLEFAAQDCGLTLCERLDIGRMPVLDWAPFRLRHLATAVPRLLLNMLMHGPGPKHGNVLGYVFEKSSENRQER